MQVFVNERVKLWNCHAGPWTEDELKLARDRYAAGYLYGEIDKAL